MIVTLNWLKDFVPCALAPEELSHRLTMAGLEVDALAIIGGGMDDVVVAKLLSVERHPDAERLTLCRVTTGKEELQIVCGATNHRTGDLVALAQVGSVLPGDFRIKKSKIRGQESMGMLCSEKELGLAEESAGIMILPQGLPLGVPVFEALGRKDVCIEIGLTPNRPDCLSIAGVAREVAALTGERFRLPGSSPAEAGPASTDATSVTIEDPEFCPRYAARLIRGVKIGPSPDWLASRLEAVGMRPINNVVDVTNYVMMELGHPLHAFDFELLRGQRIVVKRAAAGERFTTLDSQVRELCAEDLVICDAEGPVALAGVMGGENSEIQTTTVDVLLEAAYFTPSAIRRTSRRLGIHTESSHRFERGADVDMVPVAIDRAAELILETAGGTLCKGLIDCYPAPPAERAIELRYARTNAILGLSLEAGRIRQLLESIGVRIESERSDTLVALVPSWRPDLEREIDLIEEVARLNGYDEIPVTMPKSQLICHQPEALQRLQGRLRDGLVAAGFSEVINYSFIAPSAWDKIGLPADDVRRQCVSLLNPLTEEQSIMRSSLIPSLLDTVARNLAYRSLDLRLFELRPVFAPRADAVLASEVLHLAGALTGQRNRLGWGHQAVSADFFDLKGVIEDLLEICGVSDVSWQADAGEPFLHPGKSCRLLCQGRQLGVMGEVHPKVQRSYDLGQPVLIVDLDVTELLEAAGQGESFQPISRFPDVFRDTAVLVDEALSAGEVLRLIEQRKAAFAEDVVLFDVYRGKGVPEGKKSLAFRVRYRSAEKTFTDEEINQAHARIVKALDREFGAELR